MPMNEVGSDASRDQSSRLRQPDEPLSRTRLDIDRFLNLVKGDVEALLAAPFVIVGAARPPHVSGVYAFAIERELVYVGEAKGSNGLRDRILSKHISGDDRHTLQRHFRETFKDRVARRAHILSNVSVSWLAIPDPDRVAAVERMLIWLLKPRLNLR